MNQRVGAREALLGVWWLVAWMATASANDVSLSYERWARLRGVEEPVEVVAPGPRVAWRELQLAPLEEGRTLVVLRWRLDAVEPGWFDERVVGPMVTVDGITWRGRPATSATEAQGTRVTAWVDGPGMLELRGWLAQSPERSPMALEALAAAVGVASVPRGWAIEGEGVAWLGAGRWGATGARLSVAAVPETREKAKTLASASVGVGMTVSDAEVRVAARVVWRVARGQLPEVRFQAPSVGADLDVTGPLVASWRKEGSEVVVQLRDKEAARIEITARWSQATPQDEQASVAVPQVTPSDVYRTTYGLQVARDGEVEVVPAADGWEARAAAQLPPWARGLVEGTPTAAYITPRSQGASLKLYRFTPVPQPPTLIDVQQITAALTDEGRVLMRVSYAVRNERGAFLRVEAPPGLRILGAVVAGETAEPAADGDAWLLPLKKSVETVHGLLSFPVQLVLVGELDPWATKEERALGLPVVDAEVALSQVTVHLPPGYVGRHDDDDNGIVPAFSEGTGIAYGFSVGDARAAQADRLFQSAVSSWMGNRFDEAQQALDELTALGADNENVARLQSNLDLLEGKGSGGGGVALERRVKEQAKARSIDDARRQAAVLEHAEEALIRGDYDQAEAAYGEALKLGDKLGKLDHDEDLANRFKNLEVEAKLAETRALKKQKSVSKKIAHEDSRRAQEEEVAREVADRVRIASGVPEEVMIEEPAEGVVVGDVAGTVVTGALGGVQARRGVVNLPSFGGSKSSATPAAPADPVVTEPTSRAPVLTGEWLEQASSGRSYQQAVAGEVDEASRDAEPTVATGVSAAARPRRKEANKEEALARLRADIDRPTIEISLGGGDELPDVKATSLDVIVPAQGEAVRYQRHLVPADADQVVIIKARRSRRTP